VDTEKIGQKIGSWLKRKTGETESGPDLGDPRTLLISRDLVVKIDA